jgi:rubredoxin
VNCEWLCLKESIHIPAGKTGLIRFTRKGVERNMPADEKNARWVCLECHYIYDPVKGDPKNGIPAGTPWEEVPDDWRCPECRILKCKKGVFRRLED